MCKKRKIITITVLFVLGVAVSYLQWGREIDVVGSMGTSSENFHEEHVTFTLNRLIITDKEKCAEEIIKKCRENDFACRHLGIFHPACRTTLTMKPTGEIWIWAVALLKQAEVCARYHINAGRSATSIVATDSVFLF